MPAPEPETTPAQIVVKDSQEELLIYTSVESQNRVVLHIDDGDTRQALGPRDIIVNEVDPRKYSGSM